MNRYTMSRFTALRNDEPEDLGGETLASRLAQFTLDTKQGEHARENGFEPDPDPIINDDPPGNADDPPVDPPVDPPIEIEEEDFPTIGSIEKNDPPKDEPKPFDESEFDKETALMLKSIEEKGHPGEIYKDLRAKLKDSERKLASSKPNLDEIPEVQELKTKAEAAEAMKEELEGLKKRNEELLKVGDEAMMRQLPEFVDNVTKPLKEMDDFLNVLAESTKISKELFIDIIEEKDLATQDKALEALEKQIGRRNASRIERMIDDYAVVRRKEAKMLEDAVGVIEKSRVDRQKRDAQEAERKQQAYKAATRESFANQAKRIPGFTDSSGNLTATANALIKTTISIDPTTLSMSDLGYMAFATQSLPVLRKEFLKLQAELAVLKGGKSTPAPIAGKKPDKKPDEEPNEEMGLSERMRGVKFTI